MANPPAMTIRIITPPTIPGRGGQHKDQSPRMLTHSLQRWTRYLNHTHMPTDLQSIPSSASDRAADIEARILNDRTHLPFQTGLMSNGMVKVASSGEAGTVRPFAYNRFCCGDVPGPRPKAR